MYTSIIAREDYIKIRKGIIMNKPWVKHLILIICLAIPLFFINFSWIGCNESSNPSYKYETVKGTEPRVYITNTGGCYHSGSCGHLYKSKIPIGLYEARNAGYTACSDCGGHASGTISVTYEKKVGLSDSQITSKKVWGGLGITVLAAPLIYLFAYCIIKDRKENAWIYKGLKNGSKKNTEGAIISNGEQIKSTTSSELPEREKLQKYLEDYSDEQIQRLKYKVVIHQKFGEGYISKIERRYVWIMFSNNEEKMFQFPDAFVNETL